MKIAVYTIALNEEKHVKRWYESAKDADYLLIADTGSTDDTVKIAKKLGINVIKISIKPWRFDDSRNAALAALPDDVDYCVSMDMDETLSEGWRECLEKMTADQIDYMFNLNFRDEAEEHPDDRFINNRIHKRHGFRWQWLMHEAIVPSRQQSITTEFCEGLEVSHHPDEDKSRDQYNQMIEDAFNEYKNVRYHIYHATQLVAFKRYDEAAEVLRSLINIKSEQPEKFDIASAYRLLALCEPQHKIKYFKKSLRILETKETLTELAIHYFEKEQWFRSYRFAKKAIKINKKSLSLLRGLFAWGYLPNNLYSAAKYNRKLFKLSKSYDEKKRTFVPGSFIAHNFKIFND